VRLASVKCHRTKGQKALSAGRESFFAQCGDNYIDNVTTGGRLVVYSKIESKTTSVESTNKQQIDAAAKGGQISGQRAEETSFMRQFQSQIQVLRNGKNEDTPSRTSLIMERSTGQR
jgi:hypothetical protein